MEDKIDKKDEFSGTVIFQKVNAGSKSESVQPFLYVNKDKVLHLFLKGSNPFENTKLQKFDGKYVSASGTFNGSTFIIENITANDAEQP